MTLFAGAMSGEGEGPAKNYRRSVSLPPVDLAPRRPRPGVLFNPFT
jgi:hypothetical protein